MRLRQLLEGITFQLRKSSVNIKTLKELRKLNERVERKIGATIKKNSGSSAVQIAKKRFVKSWKTLYVEVQ